MWKVFSFYNNFLNVEFLWNFDIKLKPQKRSSDPFRHLYARTKNALKVPIPKIKVLSSISKLNIHDF